MKARPRNWFVKGHGLGNDYLVVEPKDLSFKLTVAAVRAICDRHTGVGSDGILALVPSRRADFGVRIFNPDGSEAEKSGNGLRILSRFLYDHRHTRKRNFTIETRGGVARAALAVRRGRVAGITVDVGRATFHSDEIPVAGPSREVLDEPLTVEGETIRVTAVSVGNPHCVVFVDALDVSQLRRLGPHLETHPAFPRRTNVQMAKGARAGPPGDSDLGARRRGDAGLRHERRRGRRGGGSVRACGSPCRRGHAGWAARGDDRRGLDGASDGTGGGGVRRHLQRRAAPAAAPCPLISGPQRTACLQVWRAIP